MTAILILVGVVAIISLYDFFSTRNWQQVTSAVRNETVFENRNKNYGAFKIRRDYNRNFILILLGMVGGVGVIYAAAATLREPVKKEAKLPPIIEENGPVIEFDPKDEPKPEVDSKQQQTPQPPMDKFTPPVVTSDPTKPTDPVVDPGTVGPVKNPGPGDIFTPPTPPIDPPGPPTPPPPPKEPEIPAVPAEFPGGRKALAEFLGDNLRYPQLEAEEGIGGKCYLRFVVSKTGEISRVSVIRKIADCPACDKEAQRVVLKMPKWTPGKDKHGEPVDSYFNLPITFLPPQ